MKSPIIFSYNKFNNDEDDIKIPSVDDSLFRTNDVYLDKNLYVEELPKAYSPEEIVKKSINESTDKFTIPAYIRVSGYRRIIIRLVNKTFFDFPRKINDKIYINDAHYITSYTISDNEKFYEYLIEFHLPKTKLLITLPEINNQISKIISKYYKNLFLESDYIKYSVHPRKRNHNYYM